MLIFRRTTWNGFRFGFWCRVLHVLAHNLKYRDNWESEINHDGTAPTRNRCRNRPSVKPVVGEAGAPTVDLHPVDHGAPSLLPSVPLDLGACSPPPQLHLLSDVGLQSCSERCARAAFSFVRVPGMQWMWLDWLVLLLSALHSSAQVMFSKCKWDHILLTHSPGGGPFSGLPLARWERAFSNRIATSWTMWVLPLFPLCHPFLCCSYPVRSYSASWCGPRILAYTVPSTWNAPASAPRLAPCHLSFSLCPRQHLLRSPLASLAMSRVSLNIFFRCLRAYFCNILVLHAPLLLFSLVFSFSQALRQAFVTFSVQMSASCQAWNRHPVNTCWSGPGSWSPAPVLKDAEVFPFYYWEPFEVLF